MANESNKTGKTIGIIFGILLTFGGCHLIDSKNGAYNLLGFVVLFYGLAIIYTMFAD